MRYRRGVSLVFYFAPMSTASITAAVLAELGVPCERVDIDIDAGDTRTPEFLAVNPNGMVPVIVHDGVPIWESSAITMYLGEVFGVAAGLYPPPGPQRGNAMKWIAWSSIGIFAAAGRFAATLPVGTPGAVQEGAAEFDEASAADVVAHDKAKADIAAQLRIADDALDGQLYLAGDYCLADTHLHAIVGWLAMMGIDLAPFSNLQGWVERCDERPALKALAEG